MKSNAPILGLDTQESKSPINVDDESDSDFRSNTMLFDKAQSSPKKVTEPNKSDNEKLQDGIEKSPVPDWVTKTKKLDTGFGSD